MHVKPWFPLQPVPNHELSKHFLGQRQDRVQDEGVELGWGLNPVLRRLQDTHHSPVLSTHEGEMGELQGRESSLGKS